MFTITDTSDYIKSCSLAKIQDNPRCQILLNKFRIYTGSIHVYKEMQPNQNVATKLYEFLEKKLPKNLKISTPNEAANISIVPRESGKSWGIKHLKRLHPTLINEIIMIGDSYSDLETKTEVTNFYTVGNASTDVKKAADYSAEHPYARGVMELLRKINSSVVDK